MGLLSSALGHGSFDGCFEARYCRLTIQAADKPQYYLNSRDIIFVMSMSCNVILGLYFPGRKFAFSIYLNIFFGEFNFLQGTRYNRFDSHVSIPEKHTGEL